MPPNDTTDVRINEVVTDIAVTEGAGPLSAEDLKRIVAIVMAHVRTEQDRLAQRAKDTTIRDRAYQPRTGDQPMALQKLTIVYENSTGNFPDTIKSRSNSTPKNIR